MIQREGISCLAEGGNFKSGFLNYGKGKVADSEYLAVIDAGVPIISQKQFIKRFDLRVFHATILQASMGYKLAETTRSRSFIQNTHCTTQQAHEQ
jgi:hypothetical protein